RAFDSIFTPPAVGIYLPPEWPPLTNSRYKAENVLDYEEGAALPPIVQGFGLPVDLKRTPMNLQDRNGDGFITQGGHGNIVAAHGHMVAGSSGSPSAPDWELF